MIPQQLSLELIDIKMYTILPKIYCSVILSIDKLLTEIYTSLFFYPPPHEVGAEELASPQMAVAGLSRLAHWKACKQT